MEKCVICNKLLKERSCPTLNKLKKKKKKRQVVYKGLMTLISSLGKVILILKL